MATFPIEAPPGIPQGMSRAPGPSGGKGQPVNSPGIWGAPGQAPSHFPPGPGAEGGREFEMQKQISGTIEGQVAQLIDAARHDTESKVKMELKILVDAMRGMDARLDQLLVQLDGVDAPAKAAEPPMDAEAVNALLSKVEQQWGQQIRMLKQELHQTILAHNHNADLIKHHKDTIDSLREKCTKLMSNNTKTTDIQQQLQNLDARLKQQQKQRKLEPIFERLTVLEQRVAGAIQRSYGGYPGMPSMGPPGVPGVPPGGIVPGMLPPGMAAPNMVGTRARPKPGAEAAYRCPTDEEVQARLGMLSGPGGDVLGDGVDA